MKKCVCVVMMAAVAVLVMYSCSYADTFYIRAPSLSVAQVGKHASYKFSVTDLGGKSTAGVAWSMSGSIPGMSFSSATATLSGTPTREGFYSFTVTARRRYSTGYTPASDNVNCSLTVKAADKPKPSNDDDSGSGNNDDSSGGGSGGGNEGTDYDSIITTINATNFPDDVFREYVSSNFDNDSDGYLRTSEIASAHTIDVNSKGISSLKGIEYFTALTELDCGKNQLTELNVNSNTALTTLWCDNNQLTELYVSGNTALTTLWCANNQLTYINITGCKSLKTFLHDDNVQIIDKSKIAEINAQNFPDYEFMDYVRSYFDENGNGYLDVWEIAGATTINVNNKGISSLKGIEYFTALTELYCYSNELKTLDVSKNTTLRTLSCSENQLTTLDVSRNTALQTLSCGNNQLTALDVSKNTALTELICGSVQTESNIFGDEYHYKNPSSYNSNQLTTLDVSKNIALECLDCSSNQLKTLDVSKNTALTELWCYNNELTSLILGIKPALTSLHCDGNQLTQLDVRGCPAITTENFIHDDNVNIIEDIMINATNFPDDAFREYVSSTFDTDRDGLLSKAEISAVTYTNVSNKGISSLQGVKYFTSLVQLDCNNNHLTTLDVSGCSSLVKLDCWNNQLTVLDVRGCTSLEELDCENNQLIVLDVSGCTSLWYIDCSNNQLVALVVPNKDKYCKESSRSSAVASDMIYRLSGKFYLYVTNDDGVLILDSNTPLTIPPENLTIIVAEIKTQNFPDDVFREYVKSNFDKDGDGCLNMLEVAIATTIDVDSKGITSLKGIEYFTALTKLYCYSNQLTELDVSGCTALTYLYCFDNKLTSLNVNGSTALQTLYCESNQLTTLDVSGCTALTYLNCSSNQLTELDVSANTALTYLSCWRNQLTTLDVSNNTALKSLDCYYNQLTTLDVSANTALQTLSCWSNQLIYIIIGYTEPESFSPDYGVPIINGENLKELVKELVAEINTQNFPDDVFREYVKRNFDGDGDGYLNMFEVAIATTIDVDSRGITSLKGIEYFTALMKLDCDSNQLTTLDMSANTVLISLSCGYNQLTELDVSKNTALRSLDCYYNQLTTLDVSKNTALTSLRCSNNQLTALDVSGCTALTTLWCESNQLTTLDVSKNTALTSLRCSNNQLTALDVSKNTALTTLACDGNVHTISSNTTLTISTTTLPDVEVGTDYSATLSANLSGVTWSATYLPSWLKLNASTGELSGKPTIGRGYSFTVTASLASLKASKTYTITTSTATSTVKPEFRTHSLVLSGQIGVNFFMYLPEISGIDYTKSYVEFDINSDKSNPPQYFDPTFKNSKGTYYGFRCYIKSIQMADKITATFHYGNNQTVTHEYSAKKYLDDSLAANISSEERALIEAIKDYGHYAQLYLSSIHTWELGRDYAAIDCENDYSAADIETVRKAVAGNAIVRDTGTASGVQRVGFSLSLDSDTNINLYIYPASGYTGAVSATLSGSNENLAVYQSNRNRYEVKISNISAHKLSDTYTVRVKAQKEFDVKVSAFSYVCDALNDSATSEAERKAVVSLYKYYVTTMNYRAATGQ